MKAIIWDGENLGVGDATPAPIDETSCRLRVNLAGICATDLEITRGYFGYQGVLGHEFVGTVDEGPEEWLGKRVVADINCGCGICVDCVQADGHHCEQRTVIGILGRPGAFAENIVVPTKNLVEVPPVVTDEAAVFAEPLAAALQIQEQIHPPKDEPIIVLGDGRLGLLIAASLVGSGYVVELLGRHPERTKLYEDLGLDFVGLKPRARRSLVVEATGRPTGFQTAIESLRPQGTLVLKSTYAGGFHFDPAPLVVNEITILGSRCGSMASAVHALTTKMVDPIGLVDAQYAIEDGVHAFAHAARSGTLKVLIRP